MNDTCPILEFDTCREAVIEPATQIARHPMMPECAVPCFFQPVIDKLVDEGRLEAFHHVRSNMGDHPVYRMDVNGTPVAVFQAGLGAPFAAAFVEEVIALGARKFVACGSCGVLDGGIGVGDVIVPTSAVRDEGTSYHYLPPSREVAPTANALAAIERVLWAKDYAYVAGKTWTTDAFYRETRSKVDRRIAEGCITVEMEAAAYFAVARFRGVEFGQMLFAADDLSGEEWDSRDHHHHASSREEVFLLAAQACASM